MDSAIKCPWCRDTNFLDSHELSDGNHEKTCDHCGNRFTYHVQLEISRACQVEPDEEGSES